MRCVLEFEPDSCEAVMANDIFREIIYAGGTRWGGRGFEMLWIWEETNGRLGGGLGLGIVGTCMGRKVQCRGKGNVVGKGRDGGMDEEG